MLCILLIPNENSVSKNTQPSIKGMFDCNQMRNARMDFSTEIAVFGFPEFLPFDWEIQKGFEKLFLRTAVFHLHTLLAK